METSCRTPLVQPVASQRAGRPRRRWGDQLLITVTVVLLGVAGLAPAATAQPATPPTAAANWLFTVNFRSAVLVASPAGGGPATLTLKGVDTDALAFTDRPQRLAALVPVTDFVALVAGAAADPPNALLVVRLPGRGDGVQVVLVLRSASYDRAAGTLTLMVTITARQATGTPVAGGGGTRIVSAGYLFVDGLSLAGRVPVTVPVNVCGNTVVIVGALNPTVGNTCGTS